MKQLIVLEEIEDRSIMDIMQIICDASLAFVKDDLKHNSYLFAKYKTYPCRTLTSHGYVHYKDNRLDEMSHCNYMAGRKRFAVKEFYEDGVLKDIQEMPDENIYDCNVELSQDTYEDWLFKGMPKTVAVGSEAMSYILRKAEEYNFHEYVEYFKGTSRGVNYLTFVPMDDNIIDSLAKNIQLFGGSNEN